MAALYSHTTRTTGTILTATIYNADHQNHIDNGIPAQLDDYSTNVIQMQLTTDPGEVGTESLPGNLAGELERLRFAIAEIKNRLNGGVTPQWYATASGAVSGTDGVFSGTVSGTVGTFATLNAGIAGVSTDFLNITSSGAINTFLRWKQTGIGEWSAGMPNTLNRWVLSTGAGSGTALLSVTAAGSFSFTGSIAATGSVASTSELIGATQTLTCGNTDNTNAASHAQLRTLVGGASGGDPFLLLSIAGAQDWHIGVDNSTADALKIGTGSAVGTNTLFQLDTSGNVTMNATLAGSNHTFNFSNLDDTNASSHANFLIAAGGSSGGDPALKLGVTGLVTWSIGLDNSDSDNFKIGSNTLVGTATWLTLDSSGRLSGKGLHDNASLPSGTTEQYIASGTYTPTLTNVLNVTSSIALICQWIRVGNVVTVSGLVTIDPTSVGSPTELDLSLPIASNLASAQQLGGTGCIVSAAGNGGSIQGDTANDRARYEFVSNGTAAVANHAFSFQYLIV